MAPSAYHGLADALAVLLNRLWRWLLPTCRLLAVRASFHLNRNLTRRRVLSFPHLLVAFWFLIILWGERWIFASKVASCDWDSWEHWPKGATPHRLIFVADPQIIDPHSYPGRPWPINPITMRITDNYMKRSYVQLQKLLHPDTVFFLGDLFDGGREWSAEGDTEDPVWGRRPEGEKKFAQEWKKNLGDDYWLSEYARFGDIFYEPWNLGGVDARPWQRGRKVISSLPGNHDLGFGDEIKVSVRKRFNAHFGDVNRLDVIGNHTFVSLDTVSLSADTSMVSHEVDLEQIYGPTQKFLQEVKSQKRRAVERELKFWRGEEESLVWEHKMLELEKLGSTPEAPTMDRGTDAPEFPTILLTHVPLYRDPGTPCGPFREHWPPAKPPKGQKGPVSPDHANAIRVSGGYQYQNVLSDEDSRRIISSVGNVVHAFSGDDHDYCEVLHTADHDNVLEITVKSFSMAMGVPTPGFQMVSLYNPVDTKSGAPLLPGHGTESATLQTHLCLLPSQLHTYLVYTVLGLLTVGTLTVRAALLPILGFEPFAFKNFDPSSPSSLSAAGASSGLPLHNIGGNKKSDDAYPPAAHLSTPTSGVTSASKSSPRSARTGRANRGLSVSSNGSGFGAAAGRSASPRIQIRKDYFSRQNYSVGGSDVGVGGGSAKSSRGSGFWRPAAAKVSVAQSRQTLKVVVRELWTTVWRVVWMILLFFAWVTYRG